LNAACAVGADPLGGEHAMRKQRRLARVGVLSLRLLGAIDQLGTDADLGVPVQEHHFVVDGSEMAAAQGNHSCAADPHSLAERRGVLHVPPEQSRSHVERSSIAQDLRAA
jgi:hypothetical protein